MFLCEPNAGFYELNSVDSTLIDGFLAKGLNVVAWNYQGYNKDENYFCSLDVRLLDNHSQS